MSKRSSARRASTRARPATSSAWRSASSRRYDGEVPGAMEDLVTLPGVGRKTANVVRSVAFGLPGLPVDTHVLRLSRRLGHHHRDRSGQGRVRAQCDDPAAERGRVQLADDLARPPHVLRPQAQLRRVRAWPTSAPRPVRASRRLVQGNLSAVLATTLRADVPSSRARARRRGGARRSPHAGVPS